MRSQYCTGIAVKRQGAADILWLVTKMLGTPVLSQQVVEPELVPSPVMHICTVQQVWFGIPLGGVDDSDKGACI